MSLISGSHDLVTNEPACCAGINLYGFIFRRCIDLLKTEFLFVSRDAAQCESLPCVAIKAELLQNIGVFPG